MKKKLPVILSFFTLASYLAVMAYFATDDTEKKTEASGKNEQEVSAPADNKQALKGFTEQEGTSFFAFTGEIESIKSEDGYSYEVIVNDNGNKQSFYLDAYSKVYDSLGEEAELLLGSAITAYVNDKQLENNKYEPSFLADFAIVSAKDSKVGHYKIGLLNEQWKDTVNNAQLQLNDETAITNLSGTTVPSDVIKDGVVAYFYEETKEQVIAPFKIVWLRHDIVLDETFEVIEDLDTLIDLQNSQNKE